MSPIIFESVDDAIAALDRMFPGLEALVVDGDERHLSGVIQKVDKGPRPRGNRTEDGETVFTFLLDVMAARCPADEKVIGVQIGVRGEFCGTVDEHREFRELARQMTGVWEIRRV